MSYQVYRAMTNAKAYNDDLKSGSKEDYLEDKIFENIKMAFDGIYSVAQFNRKLYFDLKGNWKLLRNHNYDEVLENISNWLLKADDRYNGEMWIEKIQAPKPNGTIIKDETFLQKICDALEEDGISYLVEHNYGERYITLGDIEFEIDDEDYDRIYFNTINHEYKCYKRGIKLALMEFFKDEGIVNYKINTVIGEIKFYQ